ncbi:hypothetical protein PHYBOEH_009591 [Phytophthora boehmeriae]|uniref:Uncharacterized protein n=1 Tax=Phytophthora boehmeriae TaxID=109152 RepID=A0A8T1X0S3_9STRA|nr:hypothetical protein PHYBOEH_009591 [Phytophthora boehmeriae]
MSAREAKFAVTAALGALENAYTEYSYWMKQYKHHIDSVGAWVHAADAGEDDTAPRYRLFQQLLQDTRYGLECATRGISEARRELISARDFYLRVAGLLAQKPAAGEDFLVAEGAERLAPPPTQGPTAISRQRPSSLEETIQAEIGANARRNWTLSSQRPVPTASGQRTPAVVPPTSVPASRAADCPQVNVVQDRVLSSSASIAPAQRSSPVTRVQRSKPVTTESAVPTSNNSRNGANPPATASGTTLSPQKRRRGRELEFLIPCKRKKYSKAFRWDDETMHYFPKDVDIPTCALSTMWIYWICGNAADNYPPFRILTSSDLESEAARRSLSSLRFVMLEIESRIIEKDAWTNDPTPEEAASMFDAVTEGLSVRPHTVRQHFKPVGNLKWTSLGRIICEQRKLLDEIDSEGGSEAGEDK